MSNTNTNTNNEVKIVRLASGEELICKVWKSPDYGDFYILEDIGVLIPFEESRLGIAPFMAYGKYERLELPKAHVMFVVEPVSDLLDMYQKMFSRILTPSSGLTMMK